MYLPMNWKKAPTIEIDHSKCIVPMYCKLCLQACPQACFQVHNARFDRLKECNREKPGDYVLSAHYAYACTMCNECAFVCPQAAIRPFLAEEDELTEAPEGFIVREMRGANGQKYRIQVSVEECTGCGLCVEA